MRKCVFYGESLVIRIAYTLALYVITSVKALPQAPLYNQKRIIKDRRRRNYI